MNTKFNNFKTQTKLFTDETFANLKSRQGFKNIFVTGDKPKRYIVTLRPLSREINLPEEIHPNAETQKVIINEEDVLKGKFMFDIKSIAKTILEKIEEKSENSTSSLENGNYDLKLKQTKTDIFRLAGGWGLNTKNNRKEKDNGEPKSRVPTENEEPKNETQERLAVDNIKNKISQMKEIEEPSLTDNTSVVLKQTATSNHKFENKNSHVQRNNDKAVSTTDNQPRTIEQTVFTGGNQSTPDTPNEIITSSFIENLLEKETPQTSETQKFSQASSKSQIKNIIPLCGESHFDHLQCNTLDTSSMDSKLASELFCILPSEKEISKRIENLEEQVRQLNLELKHLQKEILPEDDLAKINILSKYFHEVDNILEELKVNCSKLKNIENQMTQRKPTNINEKVMENLQATRDFIFDDNRNRLIYPDKYLETCNCGTSPTVIDDSEKCGDRPFQICPCKWTQIPIDEQFSHSTLIVSGTSTYNHQTNFNNFRMPCNCIKYVSNFQEQNSIEQTRQQTQQERTFTNNTNFLNKKLSEMTSTFHQPTEENLAAKFPLRAEEDNYVSVYEDISPINTTVLQQTNLSTYSNNNKLPSENHFKYLQKETNNNIHKSLNKEFSAFAKQDSNKKRKLAGKETSTYFNRPSTKKNTNTDSFISTDLSSEDKLSNTNSVLPLTTHNLSQAVWEIIGNRSSKSIALTIFLESNNLYHINVSAIETGQCIGCLYTNEAAFKQAKYNKLFDKFLLFFVINSDNTIKERNKVLGHSFEFINIRKRREFM